ncbi:MAG: cytochrome P450 [Actinobacteria bacterium]|nr:cytochrome P450 [Actinomycetota bacterium]
MPRRADGDVRRARRRRPRDDDEPDRDRPLRAPPRREAWRQLVRDPGALENGVEELLRYVSPAHWLPRRAIVDLEIGAVCVRAGTTVVPLLGAANRDPDAFPDPDRLRLARPEARRHLALGWGRHFCLGASLARLEATVAFRELARRFPRLELATERLDWTGNAVLRRLAALPVRPGPEATRVS